MTKVTLSADRIEAAKERVRKSLAEARAKAAVSAAPIDHAAEPVAVSVPAAPEVAQPAAVAAAPAAAAAAPEAVAGPGVVAGPGAGAHPAQGAAGSDGDSDASSEPEPEPPRRRGKAKPKAAAAAVKPEDDDEDLAPIVKRYVREKAKKYVTNELAVAMAAMQLQQQQQRAAAPAPAPHGFAQPGAYADAYTMARANLMTRVDERVRAQAYSSVFPNRKGAA